MTLETSWLSLPILASSCADGGEGACSITGVGLTADEGELNSLPQDPLPKESRIGLYLRSKGIVLYSCTLLIRVWYDIHSMSTYFFTIQKKMTQPNPSRQQKIERGHHDQIYHEVNESIYYRECACDKV